jgi:fibronectin type 3 domain-containing protein
MTQVLLPVSRPSKAPSLLVIAAFLLFAANPTDANAAPHSVLLHWAASQSAVAGYNVYRATKSGGPYTKLTSTPVPAIQYTDTAVEAGQTYFYAVTAVDAHQVEGAKSTEIRATVPTP